MAAYGRLYELLGRIGTILTIQPLTSLEKNSMKKILFSNMVSEDCISPAHYWCAVKEGKERENGILYFRKQMRITQIEAANLLDIPASTLYKYETGENQCPVTACQKMPSYIR